DRTAHGDLPLGDEPPARAPGRAHRPPRLRGRTHRRRQLTPPATRPAVCALLPCRCWLVTCGLLATTPSLPACPRCTSTPVAMPHSIDSSRRSMTASCATRC